MSVKINNYSMWTDKKYEKDYYEWCVFVDEPAEVIGTIKSVEYTLHPTFPDPVRLVETKSNKFALFLSGWGEFSIRIRINYEDGSSATSSHYLHLHPDDWPRKQAPDEFATNEAKLVYKALLHEKYRWRKIDTVVRNTSLPTDSVLQNLNDLQNEDLVRKASFLSIDGKEMWGATAIVGMAPK